MSNKKLDNLSLEDLLKALETSPEIEDQPLALPSDTPPILEFIDRFKLEAGSNRVETRLLWNLYLQYYPQTITQNIFCEMMGTLLPYRLKGGYFSLKQTKQYLFSLLINKKVKPRKIKKLRFNDKHFGTFFTKLNISAGEEKIPWFAIYHIYRCYCIDNKIKRPRSKPVFLKYISNFFKKIVSNDGSLFLVDKVTAHSIPKEDYERLKKLYEKENHTSR